MISPFCLNFGNFTQVHLHVLFLYSFSLALSGFLNRTQNQNQTFLGFNTKMHYEENQDVNNVATQLTFLFQLTFLKHKIIQYHAKGETRKYNSSLSSPTVPLPLGSFSIPPSRKKKIFTPAYMKSDLFKKII